jgi:hypothetical protein
LTGSEVKVATTDTVLVLCEVEVWADYSPAPPTHDCDGCSWRLQSCASALDHWDVDYAQFLLGVGQGATGGK